MTDQDRFGTPTEDQAGPAKIESRIRTIPAKRTASYTIPLTDDPKDVITAKVNVSNISFQTRGGYALSIDKKLAQVEAFQSLLTAVAAELKIQGIEE